MEMDEIGQDGMVQVGARWDGMRWNGTGQKSCPVPLGEVRCSAVRCGVVP